MLDAYATRDVEKAREVCAAGRGDRRRLHLALPRAPHLHDGGSAQHHACARICSSAPRTSSASATTPPTSPRRSIYLITGEQWDEPRQSSTRDRRLDAQGNGTMAKPLILIVEDEEPLTLLLRYNLEAEGYEVEVGRRAATRPRCGCASACPISSCSTGCCPASPASSSAGGCARRDDTRAAADPHADGARRGGRAHPRPRHRRRRLRREAVLGARADGAREGAPAPRPAGGDLAAAQAPATSSSTARRSASAAPAARCISGRPSSACSNS